MRWFDWLPRPFLIKWPGYQERQTSWSSPVRVRFNFICNHEILDFLKIDAYLYLFLNKKIAFQIYRHYSTIDPLADPCVRSLCNSYGFACRKVWRKLSTVNESLIADNRNYWYIHQPVHQFTILFIVISSLVN
jgi:hypothetical protein